MSGHQHSALLLHGLDESDRNWILSQLAEEDQHILCDHLAELQSLGIPADSSLTEEILARGSSDTPEDPLRAASAAQMQALLAEEPQWLVKQVLALEDWPWRHDFMALLPAHARARHGEPIAISAKAAACLRHELALQLTRHRGMRAEARAPLPSSASSLLQALHQAVRRWL